MSNQGIKRYKLFVKTSPNCLQILRFIDANLQAIMASGMRISIEKIKRSDMDEEMIKILNKYHITRLPALRAADGKVAIGINEIMDTLKKSGRSTAMQAGVGSMLPSTGDLTGDFWARELYTTDKTGKVEIRKDQEEDDRLDMSKKISQSNMNHRGMPGPTSKRHQDLIDKNTDDVNTFDRPATPRASQHQSDNIDEMDYGGQPSGDPDDALMKQWMENNVEGKY